MNRTKVLIPETARPDVVGAMIKQFKLRGQEGFGASGCKEGKEGDKNDKGGKDDKLIPLHPGPQNVVAAEVSSC